MRKGTNNRSNRKKTKQYDKRRNETIKFHAPFEALRGFATNKRGYLHKKKSEKAEVNDKPRYKACTKTRQSSSRGRVGRKRSPEVKKKFFSPLNNFCVFKCHKSHPQTLQLLSLLIHLHFSFFLLFSEIFYSVNMTGATALAWRHLVCANGGQRTLSRLLKQLLTVMTAHLRCNHLPLSIFEFPEVVGKLNFKDLSLSINLATRRTIRGQASKKRPPKNEESVIAAENLTTGDFLISSEKVPDKQKEFIACNF